MSRWDCIFQAAACTMACESHRKKETHLPEVTSSPQLPHFPGCNARPHTDIHTYIENVKSKRLERLQIDVSFVCKGLDNFHVHIRAFKVTKHWTQLRVGLSAPCFWEGGEIFSPNEAPLVRFIKATQNKLGTGRFMSIRKRWLLAGVVVLRSLPPTSSLSRTHAVCAHNWAGDDGSNLADCFVPGWSHDFSYCHFRCKEFRLQH